jgi:hypothetical protein
MVDKKLEAFKDKQSLLKEAKYADKRFNDG